MSIFCSHSVVFPVAYVVGAVEKPYIITENITYKLSDCKIYTIEKGFRFDGTTVPKVLRSVEPRINDKIIGSAVHDHMYVNDYLRDKMSDKKARLFIDQEMLLFWNKYSFKTKKTNKIMYNFVRLFGSKIFKRRKQQ